MISWRLSWSAREATTRANYAKHRRALRTPAKFWLALLLKLVPGLYKRPIRLTLADGRVFDVREFMTLYIYKEVFVDGCYDRPDLPGDTPRVIDVGANTGLFTIRLKQRYPGALIHCYEPMPGNFEQLSTNLKANGLADVTPRREGVGGTTRQETLFVHKRNIGGHSIYADQARGGDAHTIQLSGIAEAVARLPGGSCTLLKLDCEGAEQEIILAIDAVLASRIERVIFEPTPARYDIDELKAHLNKLGYAVEHHAGLYLATRWDVLGEEGAAGGIEATRSR